MTRKLRVALLGDLLDENLHGGKTNLQLYRELRKFIEVRFEDRVEVLTVQDPASFTIASAVRLLISNCDAAVFLCPHRSLDHFKHVWNISAYVLAETGYAVKCFEPDFESKIFAIAENDVDIEQLKFAFADRPIPRFSRDDFPHSITEKLQEFLLARLDCLPKTDIPLHEELEKTVTAFQNGSAEVEVRHRFRTQVEGEFSRKHFLWRVREQLPPYDFSKPYYEKDGASFRFLATVLGRNVPCQVRPQLRKIQSENTANGRIQLFEVGFPGTNFYPNDVIEYQYAWTYPRAFMAEDKENNIPQSAGVWSCMGQPISNVTLRIKLERLFVGGELVPALDLRDPTKLPLQKHSQAGFPAGADPIELWHKDSDWQRFDYMEQPSREQSANFETYVWKSTNFLGMAKATWNFRDNYLLDRSSKNQSRKRIQ